MVLQMYNCLVYWCLLLYDEKLIKFNTMFVLAINFVPSLIGIKLPLDVSLTTLTTHEGLTQRINPKTNFHCKI